MEIYFRVQVCILICRSWMYTKKCSVSVRTFTVTTERCLEGMKDTGGVLTHLL